MHLDIIETLPYGYCFDHFLEALEGDLGKEIKKRGEEQRHFSESEIWKFVKQISSALVHIHSKVKARQGVAHRDIKPANIFLDSQGNYKIGDFECFFESESFSRGSVRSRTGQFLRLMS